MGESLSERRLVENELVFRQANERIPQALGELKEAAVAEGHDTLVQDMDIDLPLHFYCECSDETCRKRIVIRPSEYKELHQNSSQFMVVPGHQVPEVERVVFSNDKLMVIEKFETPPRAAEKLNPTELDHK